MSEEQERWIEMLEAEWSRPNGFLAKVREGKFEMKEGEAFIARLSGIKLPEGSLLMPRFVSLLWYIPLFLTWQHERVQKKGGDVAGFKRIASKAQSAIECILGYP
jgi:hypothetical protein